MAGNPRLRAQHGTGFPLWGHCSVGREEGGARTRGSLTIARAVTVTEAPPRSWRQAPRAHAHTPPVTLNRSPLQCSSRAGLRLPARCAPPAPQAPYFGLQPQPHSYSEEALSLSLRPTTHPAPRPPAPTATDRFHPRCLNHLERTAEGPQSRS